MARQHARVLRSDRFASRRKEVRRTRQRRRRRTTFTLVLVTALGVGGWMMTRTSLFALEGIDVAGTRLLTTDEIIQASGLRTGSNMLSLSVDALEARLARLPLVRSVEVSNPSPSRVRIVISERTPSFVLETKEGRWYLDANATVLLRVTDAASALPTIRLAREIAADTGDRIHAREVVDAITLWTSLPRSLRAGAPIVEAASSGFVLIRPEVHIRFGTIDRLEDKLEAVALVIDRSRRSRGRLAMIDVRSPTRPAAEMA